jgi:hypothetical protein
LKSTPEKVSPSVKRLAVPVEIPVIVFRKPAGAPHFPRQQTGRQWQAGENPHLAFLRLGKEQFCRTLAEKLED